MIGFKRGSAQSGLKEEEEQRQRNVGGSDGAGAGSGRGGAGAADEVPRREHKLENVQSVGAWAPCGRMGQG